jgi:hypothetical protein
MPRTTSFRPMSRSPGEDAYAVEQQTRWPPGELCQGRGPLRGRTRGGLPASSAMAAAPGEDAHAVEQQARWPPGELRHGRASAVAAPASQRWSSYTRSPLGCPGRFPLCTRRTRCGAACARATVTMGRVKAWIHVRSALDRVASFASAVPIACFPAFPDGGSTSYLYTCN